MENMALAKSYTDYTAKVDFASKQWIASRKLDGIRCVCKIKNGEATFWTRNGKSITTLGVLAERIRRANVGINIALDTELCVTDKNGNEDFKSITKIARKKDYSIPNPTLKVFDFMSLEDFENGSNDIPYSARLETRDYFIRYCKIEGLLPLEYERIESQEDFNRFFANARKNEWEGVMLRKDVGYKSGRTADLLKVKDFIDAEYTVEGVETDEDCLKAVCITHKGNRVNVSNGFSKWERFEFFEYPSKIIGKKITVRYFEETFNDKGGFSLRFPTFAGVRDYE